MANAEDAVFQLSQLFAETDVEAGEDQAREASALCSCVSRTAVSDEE